MKKIIYLLLGLTITITNIFGFHLFNNYNFAEKLFHKKTAVFKYYNTVDEIPSKAKDMRQTLIDFSEKTHTGVMQYEFMSETDLNIYATDELFHGKKGLKTGNLPVPGQFLSNKKEKKNKASGTFCFPFTKWNIHVYRFQDLKNVGLGETFYFDNMTNKSKKSFLKEFSVYGKIDMHSSYVNSFKLMNFSMLSIVALAFVLYISGILVFVVTSTRKFTIMRLWGYSKKQMFLHIQAQFMKLLTGIWAGQIIFWMAACYRSEGLSGFIKYLGIALIINILIFAVISLINLTAFYIVSGMELSVSQMKGKKFFGNAKWISLSLLAAVMLGVFYLINLTAVNYHRLEGKKQGLEYWNQSKNIFKIEYSEHNTSVWRGDLAAERKTNEKLSKFYETAQRQAGIFMMESDNFGAVTRSGGKTTYVYEDELRGKQAVCSPFGRRVIVDSNYLDRNPIITSNGSSVQDQMIHTKNTLNLLVPSKYKKYEKEILKEYKDYFYFQKVEVDNIYRKAMKKPLNKTPKNQLSIHIIYSKSNQTFFTYCAGTGDEKNQITDPVAILYTDVIDSSNITSMFNTYLFMEDRSKGNAYQKIAPIVKNLKTTGVDSVKNVYGEASEELVKIKEALFQQTITLISTGICAVLFLTGAIWGFYNSKMYRLSLEYLFGYSFFQCVKELIFSFLFIDVLTGLVIFFINRSMYILLYPAAAILLQGMILRIEYQYLSKKGIMRTLKGEEL